MELFQDLQKHFQSLVFNINMQYGNMISMHDFFESCKTFIPLFSDFVDLFDLVSDRCNELEDENQRFRVGWLNHKNFAQSQKLCSPYW